MADVDLIYGPGAPTAVLVGNLRSVTFKHGLSLNLEARDEDLENALRFHLNARAGTAIAAKLPKSLRMCFPVFSKRRAELTAALDDARTISLALEPPASRDAYKSIITAYCERVASYFAAEDAASREAAISGARFDDGLAHLEVDDTGEHLGWRS